MEINFENVFKEMQKINEIMYNSRDNLFSANHRNAMIQKYGYTEAERIKIEDLI